MKRLTYLKFCGKISVCGLGYGYELPLPANNVAELVDNGRPSQSKDGLLECPK
jgi:hypothetical protein